MYYEKAVQQTIDWLESHLHEPISGKDIVNVSAFLNEELLGEPVNLSFEEELQV